MPGEIDYGSADQACDRLYEAFAAGAPVVIADFTATIFCDCAALGRLLAVQRRVAVRHAQLRVVAPPRGPVRRVMEITGLDRLLQAYPSAYHAAAAPWIPPPSTGTMTVGGHGFLAATTQ
jgi:anti-anti-sigma factor